MGLKKKCVFVIGPESSGSKFAAKICSHVLDIQTFGEWDGTAWSDKGGDCVLHRSLPYMTPPIFPDVQEWINAKQDDYELYFLLTTRDITLSQISRYERWGKSLHQSTEESERARSIMSSVMRSHQKYLLWSYESFMFLKQDYLTLLYDFLNVDSDFMPELKDGNIGKIQWPDKP